MYLFCVAVAAAVVVVPLWRSTPHNLTATLVCVLLLLLRAAAES